MAIGLASAGSGPAAPLVAAAGVGGLLSGGVHRPDHLLAPDENPDAVGGQDTDGDGLPDN